MRVNRSQRRRLAAMRSDVLAANLKWPVELRRLVDSEMPEYRPARQIEAWRSREYVVQIFAERDGIERMSVSRADVTADGNFVDGIPWDDLQRLKHECGRGRKDAVEIYPADDDVVHVANMRHLWIMPLPLNFKWR